MFKITSNKILVTDPCYLNIGVCQVTLENVKTGFWHSKVEYGDNVISKLIIFHESYEWFSNVIKNTFRKEPFEVCVDSGQAGFFDYDEYPNVEEMDEAFYSRVCELTSISSNGELDFGCVSPSGYGDGGYDCYTERNELGELVMALIDFIGEEVEPLNECCDEDDFEGE
jgi:hypothetical protein